MTIGDKEVLFTTVLLVPDNIEALVEIPVGSWKIKLVMVFKPDIGLGEPPYVFTPEGDHP